MKTVVVVSRLTYSDARSFQIESDDKRSFCCSKTIGFHLHVQKMHILYSPKMRLLRKGRSDGESENKNDIYCSHMRTFHPEKITSFPHALSHTIRFH